MRIQKGGWTALALGFVLVMSPACSQEKKQEEAPKVEAKKPEPKPEPEKPKDEPSPVEGAKAALVDYAKPDAMGEWVKKVDGYLATKGDAKDAADGAALLGPLYVNTAAAALAGEQADLVSAVMGGLGDAGAKGGSAAAGLSKKVRDLANAYPDRPELQAAAKEMATLAALGSGGGIKASTLQAQMASSPAVQLVALNTLAPALDALTKASPLERGSVDFGKAGSLLCTGCRGKLEAAKGDASALAAAGTEGVVCPEAVAAAKGKAGAELIRAIAEACAPEYYGLSDKAEVASALGANYGAVRAYALASAAAATKPAPQHPLASAVMAAQSKLPKLPPLALWLTTAPAIETAAPKPVITGAPLDIVVVDESGVRVASRPVLQAKGGKLSLAERAQELSFPGKVVAPTAALTAEPKPTEGEDKPVAPADALAAALKAEQAKIDALAGTLPDAQKPPKATGTRPAHLVVQGVTDPKALTTAIEGIEKAGYTSVRLVTGTGPSDFAPALLRSPAAAGPAADVRYARPLIVHVKKSVTEVFPVGGKRTKEAPEGEDQGKAALPRQAKPWYLWEDLFKVDVPKSAPAEAVAGAVAHFGASAKAGNTVRVEIAADVPADRWVPIVAALSQAGAKAVPVSQAFPGLSCEGEGAASCPKRFPILWTGSKIPSSSKLSDKPQKRPVKEAPPPPPEKPKASPEFCNKADIKRVMGGKKGAFKFCYERELQTYPDLKGRVVVSFQIPDSGKAASIRVVSSELKKDSVHNCIKKAIKKLNFEKPRGGVCAVKWPFKFQP